MSRILSAFLMILLGTIIVYTSYLLLFKWDGQQ